MSKNNVIDYRYRPVTYWDSEQSQLANIKGEYRRRKITKAIARGHVDSLPAGFFADNLSEDLHASLQMDDPSVVAGEDLPDYLHREVEIARICIGSPPTGVISVRARRERRCIKYRMVVDGADPLPCFILRVGSSARPLCLQELIRLIDTSRYMRSGLPNPVVLSLNAALATGVSPRQAFRAVSVTSAFYPSLRRHYRGIGLLWSMIMPSALDINDPSESNEDGLTCLHCAAMVADASFADVLIENGAAVNARTRTGIVDAYGRQFGGLTPLHYAAFHGSLLVVERLIKAGADVNATDASGSTPLVKCYRDLPAITDALLSKGADPTISNVHGLTPLHKTVMLGCGKSTKALLDAGANPDAIAPAQNWAPLHQATTSETVGLLLAHGADPNVPGWEQATPLHYAASKVYCPPVFSDVILNGRLACLCLTIPQTDAEDDARKIAALVEAGAELESRDSLGRTPLHAAVSVSITRALIESGAELDALDDLWRTPVHEAVLACNEDLADVLLEDGATVDAQDRDGWTPLHHAADRGDEDMVRMLLYYGADTTATNNEDDTPAYCAGARAFLKLAEMLSGWQPENTDKSADNSHIA